MRYDNRWDKTVGELFYFLRRGIYWGGSLGALAGTLILPVLGTMFSVVWGWGLGATFGIVTGLLAIFLYPMRLVPEEAAFYRRRLALVAGTVTAIGAPIVLLLTSQDLRLEGLWGRWMILASVLTACVFGGLAAANTASCYADEAAGNLNRLDGFGNVGDSFWYFLTRAVNWRVFLVAATGVAVYFVNIYSERSSFYYPAQNPLSIFIEYFIGGLIGTGIGIFLLSLGIGALIGFLNQIYFVEYKTHWTMERYQIAAMSIAGMGTLGMALAWLMICYTSREGFPLVGIFVVALYAAYLACGYAERYYDMQGKLKRKGKPKNDGDVELTAEIA